MDSIPHGFMDAALVVFLFLLSIIINSLRTTIQSSRNEQAELSKAINALTLTIGRDYVTRAETEKGNTLIWERLDKDKDDINGVSQRVTRIESQRRDNYTEWKQK